MGAALSWLVFAASAAAQVTSHAQHPEWDAQREARSLGLNIDAGIRACNNQVVEETAEARATQRTLEGKGLRLADVAPPYITQLAGGKFGPARYHRWLDPHAEIWLVAYTATEACRVVVLNARYAQAARGELERLITADGFWQKDSANSATSGADWSTVFQPSHAAGMKVAPVLKLQGTSSPDADGTGLQIAALVALVRKD